MNARVVELRNDDSIRLIGAWSSKRTALGAHGPPYVHKEVRKMNASRENPMHAWNPADAADLRGGRFGFHSPVPLGSSYTIGIIPKKELKL